MTQGKSRSKVNIKWEKKEFSEQISFKKFSVFGWIWLLLQQTQGHKKKAWWKGHGIHTSLEQRCMKNVKSSTNSLMVPFFPAWLFQSKGGSPPAKAGNVAIRISALKIMHLKLVHENSETMVCELWEQICHSDVTHFAHFYKSRLSPVRAAGSLCCMHSVMHCLGYRLSWRMPKYTDERPHLSQGRATSQPVHPHVAVRASFCWSLGRDAWPLLSLQKYLKSVLSTPCLGLPWWPRGWDSVLPIQGAQVQSLVGELDPTCHNWRTSMLQWKWKSHMPQVRSGTAK